MISLMFALLAGLAVESQAVQAEFQACALENGRYVCRYVVPDIVIVPAPGANITADAPATVLGSAPSATEATGSPRVAVPAIPLDAAPPVVRPTTTGAAPGAPAVTTAASTAPVLAMAPVTTASAPVVDPGPMRPIDTDVLTERETQLVARCADAGWVSLCLPDDRRAARTLRDRQTAYLAVRREVTRLLGEERCEAAVRSALDGGYLSLARETREYCAAEAPATTTAAPAVPRPPAAAAPAEDKPAKDEATKDAPATEEAKTEAAKAARVEAEADAAED